MMRTEICALALHIGQKWPMDEPNENRMPAVGVGCRKLKLLRGEAPRFHTRSQRLRWRAHEMRAKLSNKKFKMKKTKSKSRTTKSKPKWPLPSGCREQLSDLMRNGSIMLSLTAGFDIIVEYTSCGAVSSLLVSLDAGDPLLGASFSPPSKSLRKDAPWTYEVQDPYWALSPEGAAEVMGVLRFLTVAYQHHRSRANSRP